MTKSCGCCPLMIGILLASSPVWKIRGYRLPVMVSGSSVNMDRTVNSPPAKRRVAMGMNQFGAKNLSLPRGPVWLVYTPKITPENMNCHLDADECSIHNGVSRGA